MRLQPTPLAIAHRGLPLEQPENTMAAFRAALDAGADGLETDLVLTRDARVLLWHDPEPTGFGPLVRRLGLEPGTRYRPTWPRHARPVHELTAAEARAGLGYEGSAEPVPRVEQLLDLAARDPAMPMAVWTLNRPRDMAAARDAGADLIITDDVRALRRVLDEPGRR